MHGAGIVLFYLIRQEPWAKLVRSLQVSISSGYCKLAHAAFLSAFP